MMTLPLVQRPRIVTVHTLTHVAITTLAFPRAFARGVVRGRSIRALRARMSSPNAKRARTDVKEPSSSKAPADSSSNGWLAALHAERCARRGIDAGVSVQEAERNRANERARAIATTVLGGGGRAETRRATDVARQRRANSTSAKTSDEAETREHDAGDLRLLTYNVWFGDVAQAARLEALGKVIAECDPHVLCLQEVTPQSLFALRAHEWWSEYVVGPKPQLQEYFSVVLFKREIGSELVRRDQHPFANSKMGRCLDIVSYVRCPLSGTNFAVGSSHLESYISSNRTSAQERRVQIEECFSRLNKHANAIFMGDTNWDDKDGDVPVPEGWRDAWLELRPDEPGFTYDARKNDMLRGYLQKRLDRAFVKLKHFDVKNIEMVGTQPIPGVTYHKTVSNRGKSEIIELPVLPSDHFGLLLTLRGKSRRLDEDNDAVDLT